MDPYLEQHWGDVHASLAVYIRDLLQPEMPPDLRVRIEEYIAVEDVDSQEGRRYVPDVRVVEREAGRALAAATGSAAVIADEPWIVYSEPQTQREIRIVEGKDGGRLVTVIEVLSLTNKSSGRKDYRRKQQELLAAGVNLVEIDLLRGGSWAITASPELIRDEYTGPYRICVTRGAESRSHELYRASYASRLPRIRIPLRPTDNDVVLDVQAALELAYTNGGYADLDYRQEPDPPFLPEERAWADRLLREQGRRQ